MKRTVYASCHHPGCEASTFWTFYSVKEAIDHLPTREKWMCVRHTKPEDVLSIDHPKTCKIMTCIDGYWDGFSGFVYGPGFKAFSNDFKNRTKLIVTAEIVRPEES